MERRKRIREFFHFLEEYKESEANIEPILSRFKKEIELELEYDKNISTNEYLEALIKTKDGQLETYVNSKWNGSDEEIELQFDRFMECLIQDVRLFGLGVAQ